MTEFLRKNVAVKFRNFHSVWNQMQWDHKILFLIFPWNQLIRNLESSFNFPSFFREIFVMKWKGIKRFLQKFLREINFTRKKGDIIKYLPFFREIKIILNRLQHHTVEKHLKSRSIVLKKNSWNQLFSTYFSGKNVDLTEKMLHFP